MVPERSPVRVFVSYAHEDRDWCDRLLRHLGGLVNQDKIHAFDDRQLQAGEDWNARLADELNRADVIVPIVTANFLHSPFCTRVELRRALERHASNPTRIVPIIAEHCHWQSLELSRFQVLPQDERQDVKPLSDWDDVDKPLAQIARIIGELTDGIERTRRNEKSRGISTSSREAAVTESARQEWVRPNAPDRLIGRGDDLRQIVKALTRKPSGHVAVFGTGGIGKTALTLQAATHPEALKRFGDRRCFVALEAATSPEALVAALHASLGLPPQPDPWSGIESVLRQEDRAPTLLVLDNLETPWERDPRGTEQVLVRLSQAPNVALLCSIRGGEVPVRPAWGHRHELHRLEFPHDRELFCAIAPAVSATDSLLRKALEALDGVPLAIELFAVQTQAASTLDLPWQRWKQERTTMLARRGASDRLSSLDVSVRLSLMSPRMNDAARRLFAMLGRLPRGLAVADCKALVGEGGADAALRLMQTRLAREGGGRLVMLGPIRDYAGHQELSEEDRDRLAAHFMTMGKSLGAAAVGVRRDAVLKARDEIDNIDALVDWMLADSDVTHEAARELAVTSARVADARRQLGELPLASLAYGRTLAVLERLTAAEPANLKWQRDLSIILNRVGDARRAEGDLAGALRAYDRDRGIAERLAAVDPANGQWQRDLAISWYKIGDVRQAQGDLAGALRAYQNGRTIADRLVASDPANVQWQRALAIGWGRIGYVRQAQGDLTRALRAYENDRAIAEQLAASDPNDAEWQRDLEISWNRIGDLRKTQGDLGGAMRAYEDAHAIAERLAAADPANAEWQRDLEVTWNRIGDVRQAQGDLAGALRAHEDARAIAERLAAADPANAEWQRDLALSWHRVGDLRRDQSDLAGALRAYEDARAIADRLAGVDPGDVQWQRNLEISWNRIGEVRRAAGDIPAALRAHRESHGIAERLARADPANAEWQRDLAFCLSRIARCHEEAGNRAEALAAAESSLAIGKRLAALDPTNATWQHDLEVSRGQVTRLRAKPKGIGRR